MTSSGRRARDHGAGLLRPTSRRPSSGASTAHGAARQSARWPITRATCVRAPTEVTALANDLMINVTGFFRDPEAWEAFREAVVGRWSQRSPDDTIRAWVTAACSSGEEAYSLAMLMTRKPNAPASRWTSRSSPPTRPTSRWPSPGPVFFPAASRATCRPSAWSDSSSGRDLPGEEVAPRSGGVRAAERAARPAVLAARHRHVPQPAHLPRAGGAAARVVRCMHFALREGGHLFLGNAETLGHAETLFEVVSKRWRIYRRIGAGRARSRQPAVLTCAAARSAACCTALAHAARAPFPDGGNPGGACSMSSVRLRPSWMPTSASSTFTVTRRPTCSCPPGEITQNLLDLVRPPLRPAVRSALREAIAERQSVTVEAANRDRTPARSRHRRTSQAQPAAGLFPCELRAAGRRDCVLTSADTARSPRWHVPSRAPNRIRCSRRKCASCAASCRRASNPSRRRTRSSRPRTRKSPRSTRSCRARTRSSRPARRSCRR